jgi:hypothetical protein
MMAVNRAANLLEELCGLNLKKTIPQLICLPRGSHLFVEKTVDLHGRQFVHCSIEMILSLFCSSYQE